MDETILALQQDIKTRDIAILKLEEEMAGLKLNMKVLQKNAEFSIARIESRLEKLQKMRGVSDVESL